MKNKRMNNQKKSIISLLLFAFILCILFYIGVIDFKMNGIILNGKVINYIASGAQSSGGFEYEFYYKGKRKTGISGVEVTPYKVFSNKSFPVIYSRFSGRSVLLIGPKSFKRYGIEFPDSLKWVLTFLK